MTVVPASFETKRATVRPTLGQVLASPCPHVNNPVHAVHTVHAVHAVHTVAEAMTPPKADIAKKSTTVKPVATGHHRPSQAITGHHRPSRAMSCFIFMLLHVASVHHQYHQYHKAITIPALPTGKRKPKACATMAKKTMPRVFPN